ATFQHVDDPNKSPYGHSDILFGDPVFINDPRQRTPFGSGSTTHEGNVFVGVFLVDTKDQTFFTQFNPENDIPIYPVEILTQQALIYNQAYLDHLALSAMYAEDSTLEERSQFFAEYSVVDKQFLVEVTVPRLRLVADAENPKLPFTMRIFM